MIQLVIDDTERSTNTRPTTVRVEYSLGMRARASMDVIDLDSFETAYRPQLDQRIEFKQDEELLFRGTIFNVIDSPMGAPGVGTLTRLTAVDDWARATTRRVAQSYAAGTSLRTVVEDLVDTYLGLYNINLDPDMPAGPSLPAMTFDQVTVEDAFNRLVDVSGGWVYRLRPDGIVEWFAIGTKLRPWVLSAENHNILGPITWTKGRTQFANRVCVRYGSGVTSKTETWTGDGTTTRFKLGYPPVFPRPATPLGWIGYVTYPFPGGSEGLAESDLSTWPWYYDGVSNEIARKTPPAAGATIALTYAVQYPLIVCTDAEVPVGQTPPAWRPYVPRGGMPRDLPGGDPAEATAGFAPQVATATPPTTVTATASSGGSLPATWNNELGFAVTAIGTDGNESDPYPYHFTPPTSGGGRGSFAFVSTILAPDGVTTQTIPRATFTPGDKIHVSWSGATGAVKYRCYMAYWYYGARWQRVVETTATSFDWVTGEEGDPTDTRGIWFYKVLAQMPGGVLTALSVGELRVVDGGQQRTWRGWFTPMTGALGYFVVRRGTTGGWIRQLTVPYDQLEGGHVYFNDNLVTDGEAITGLPTSLVSYENLVDRPDIFDTDEALALAEALAQQASALPRTVTLQTRPTLGIDPNILPGDTVHLDVPSRTLPDDEWLVTEVQLATDVDQEITIQLTLLEGVTQGTWLDFWRDLIGGGGAVVSAAAQPPPAEIGVMGPGPPDTSVQFNRLGTFGGNDSFTYREEYSTVQIGTGHTAAGADNLLHGADHTVL